MNSVPGQIRLVPRPTDQARVVCDWANGWDMDWWNTTACDSPCNWEWEYDSVFLNMIRNMIGNMIGNMIQFFYRSRKGNGMRKLSHGWRELSCDEEQALTDCWSSSTCCFHLVTIFHLRDDHSEIAGGVWTSSSMNSFRTQMGSHWTHTICGYHAQLTQNWAVGPSKVVDVFRNIRSWRAWYTWRCLDSVASLATLDRGVVKFATVAISKKGSDS